MMELLPAAAESASDHAGRLRVLAQLNRTFILATDGDALLLVDQHAAHERIAYEAIVAASAEGASSETAAQVPHRGRARSGGAAADRAVEALREGGLGDRTVRRADLSDESRRRQGTAPVRSIWPVFSTSLSEEPETA